MNTEAGLILGFLSLIGAVSWAMVRLSSTSRPPHCRTCGNQYPLNEAGYCDRCSKYVEH